ncbi:SDR family NAD(P)-dependent oxidoreductase [Sinomonas sp. G460-2]|uniref:SDR family NAD(P)-dependent oxidoreductase n=1 Tax=Sinomonas sp. G460-2 TaxID=3393464 RepID=UPI0039F01561
MQTALREKMSLSGRLSVVTGGAKGLGFAMGEALAEAGSAVVVCDIDAEAGTAAAEAICSRHGVDARFVAVDVTSERGVSDAVREIEDGAGPIDVLVNNAGIVLHGALTDSTYEQWRKVMSVNLDGVFLMSREVGRRMVSRGSGSIVNISSMSGMIANVPQAQASYNASKAGVIMLTKSAAVEWAGSGVRVNSIAPGYMKTALTEPFFDAGGDQIETWMRMTPMGRPGTPDELGAAAVFLASEASSFMTGSILNIDGGYTAV